MATTVIAAFNEFMKDTVNLKKADTDDARASRDWLIGKMNDLALLQIVGGDKLIIPFC
nr:hypothetical protein [Escherichia coli]